MFITQNRLFRIVAKVLIIFGLLNLIYFLWDPSVGKISGFNVLYPGLERFPYGNIPGLEKNYLLSDLDALIASHVIASDPKPSDEFRVILLGDSSTWGVQLAPHETLTAAINRLQLTTCDGRKVKAFNLAFPTPSAAKDLFILAYAREYEPDLIIWPVTLLTLDGSSQYDHPIVESNSSKVAKKVSDLDLPASFVSGISNGPSSLWDRTLLGEKREIKNIVRLQLFGMIWSATGKDQIIPATYPPLRNDFKKRDVMYMDIQPHTMRADELSFELLQMGIQLSGDAPVIIVNEPIFISDGINSDIRYNYWYPRWVYDQYLGMMAEKSKEFGWDYHDYWNLLPQDEFTTNEIHRSFLGETHFAQQLAPLILSRACP